MKVKTSSGKNGVFVMYRMHWWDGWRTLTDQNGLPMDVGGGLDESELIEMSKHHFKERRRYLQKKNRQNELDRKKTKEHNNQRGPQGP